MNNLEFEVRLGVHTGSGISSNVGQSAYSKIVSLLRSARSLKESVLKETVTYFDNHVRTSLDSPTGFEKKRKLRQEDEQYLGYNIRYCKSVEQAVPNEKVAKRQTILRRKHRLRFESDHMVYDLTHVENTDTFEVEIEMKKCFASVHSEYLVKESLVKEMKHLLTCANL